MSKKVRFNPGTLEHEKESRRRMLAMAKAKGYYEDLKQKLDYWDAKMRTCTNQKELDDMQKVAILDIFSLYDPAPGLSIDGEVVIPAEENYKEIG